VRPRVPNTNTGNAEGARAFRWCEARERRSLYYQPGTMALTMRRSARCDWVRRASIVRNLRAQVAGCPDPGWSHRCTPPAGADNMALARFVGW
jgi:hypothetical protein